MDASDRKQIIDALQDAAKEIRKLRREVQELNDYRQHTERMLALCELVAPLPAVEVSSEDGVSLTWVLNSIADRLRIAGDNLDCGEVPHG